MPKSILEASQEAKRGIFYFFKQKKFLIPIISLVVIAAVYYYVKPDPSSSQTTVVKQATVKEEDLKISISADGKVVAKDGVVLSFPVSGNLEVSEVNVKEGDWVEKGDKIASVRTESLEFELRSAYSNYQSALTNYNDKLAGADSSDLTKSKTAIAQAQVSLDQAKVSLAKTEASAAKQIADAQDNLEEASDNLARNKNIYNSEAVDAAYFSLLNSIKSVSVSLQKVLHDSDLIIGVDDTMVNNEFKNLLGVKSSYSLERAKESYVAAKELKVKLENYIIGLDSSNRFKIDEAAILADSALVKMQNHLYDMQLMLDATITAVNLSQSKLDGFKSTVNSNRSSITSSSSNLENSVRTASNTISDLKQYQIAYDKALRNLETAQGDAARDIDNAKISVRSREIAQQQAQQDYDDLVAPVNDADIAAVRSQLTSAVISVDRAKYNIEQATLVSPIDGVVSMLNYKSGDVILSDGAKSMATIINNDTLFVEVNIEEADISKLKLGQKARATFDAADGLVREGEISFISLTSDTSANGIVTYLVRVALSDIGESGIREGMTAAVDFIISEAPGVLAVPVEAVRNIGGQPSVQIKDGQISTVVTGFTDGKKVEIISGLKAGDIVTY